MEFLENTICLDSDFLIDMLRGKEQPVIWMKENSDKKFCTTTINLFELFYGAYKSNSIKEIESCERLLETLIVFSVSPNSAKIAGKIAANLDKTGNKVDFRDIIIASISITENLKLKTNNQKHFENIKDLILV